MLLKASCCSRNRRWLQGRWSALVIALPQQSMSSHRRRHRGHRNRCRRRCPRRRTGCLAVAYAVQEVLRPQASVAPLPGTPHSSKTPTQGRCRHRCRPDPHLRCRRNRTGCHHRVASGLCKQHRCPGRCRRSGRCIRHIVDDPAGIHVVVPSSSTSAAQGSGQVCRSRRLGGSGVVVQRGLIRAAGSRYPGVQISVVTRAVNSAPDATVWSSMAKLWLPLPHWQPAYQTLRPP